MPAQTPYKRLPMSMSSIDREVRETERMQQRFKTYITILGLLRQGGPAAHAMAERHGYETIADLRRDVLRLRNKAWNELSGSMRSLAFDLELELVDGIPDADTDEKAPLVDKELYPVTIDHMLDRELARLSRRGPYNERPDPSIA